MRHDRFWGRWKGERRISYFEDFKKKDHHPLSVFVYIPVEQGCAGCCAPRYVLGPVNPQFRALKMIVSLKKKVNTLYLEGKCVEFWTENASIYTKNCVSDSFNDGFYRVWLFLYKKCGHPWHMQ